MKILIDAHLAHEKLDGIGRYAVELIHGLARLDDRNEYTVITSGHQRESHPLHGFNASNFTLTGSDITTPDIIRQQLLLLRNIRKWKPDIYHHLHFDLPLTRIPSVVTIHDLKYIKYGIFFTERSFLKKRYMELMMRSSVRRAEKVISVSEATKKDLAEIFGADPRKITTVYHGYSEIALPEIIDVPKRLNSIGIRTSGFILFVGSRRPHKNIIGMIMAYRSALGKNENLPQLVLAGHEYRGYTAPRELVKELKLEDRVVFLSDLDDQDLAVLYNSASIFLFPSLYEGFGLPVLEAQGRGVPVITSNTTSLPEVAGNAAVLVDPKDYENIGKEIVILLKDNKLRDELIKKGYRNTERFTWDRTARETLEVYKKNAAGSN